MDRTAARPPTMPQRRARCSVVAAVERGVAQCSLQQPRSSSSAAGQLIPVLATMRAMILSITPSVPSCPVALACPTQGQTQGETPGQGQMQGVPAPMQGAIMQGNRATTITFLRLRPGLVRGLVQMQGRPQAWQLFMPRRACLLLRDLRRPCGRARAGSLALAQAPATPLPHRTGCRAWAQAVLEVAPQHRARGWAPQGGASLVPPQGWPLRLSPAGSRQAWLALLLQSLWLQVRCVQPPRGALVVGASS